MAELEAILDGTDSDTSEELMKSSAVHHHLHRGASPRHRISSGRRRKGRVGGGSGVLPSPEDDDDDAPYDDEMFEGREGGGNGVVGVNVRNGGIGSDRHMDLEQILREADDDDDDDVDDVDDDDDVEALYTSHRRARKGDDRRPPMVLPSSSLRRHQQQQGMENDAVSISGTTISTSVHHFPKSRTMETQVETPEPLKREQAPVVFSTTYVPPPHPLDSSVFRRTLGEAQGANICCAVGTEAVPTPNRSLSDMPRLGTASSMVVHTKNTLPTPATTISYFPSSSAAPTPRNFDSAAATPVNDTGRPNHSPRRRYDHGGDVGTSFSRPATSPIRADHSFGAHTAEDWAVLQAILDEAEEGHDDDDDEDVALEVVAAHDSDHDLAVVLGTSRSGRLHSTTGRVSPLMPPSSEPGVDDILRAVHDDDDDQDDAVVVDRDTAAIAELDDLVAKLNAPPSVKRQHKQTSSRGSSNPFVATSAAERAAAARRQEAQRSPKNGGAAAPAGDKHNTRAPRTKKTKDQAVAADGPTSSRLSPPRISRTDRDWDATGLLQQPDLSPPPSSLQPRDYAADFIPSSGAAGARQKQQYHHASSHATTADAISAAALQQAESYERKLLRRGERDIISPLMVKRRMKPRLELHSRSRKQDSKSKDDSGGSVNEAASSVSDYSQSGSRKSQHPKFGFAGIIESKSMPQVSAELQANATAKLHAVGLPTALAVNNKFIIIGTQRGIVLVFDLFEELRQQLGRTPPTTGTGGGLAGSAGLTGVAGSSVAAAANSGSVTSVDVSDNGEVLVSGYTSGAVVLWDIIKGVVLKSVTDSHPSPITNVRFVAGRDMCVVSVDAGGLVNRLSFSKNILWSAYSVDTECLLDGTAGQILAMDVLAPISSVRLPAPPGANPLGLVGTTNPSPHSHYHPSIKKIVLIALSSDRSSFAVAIEPGVHVLHRWAKPAEEKMKVEAFLSSTGGRMNGTGFEGNPEAMPQAFLPCVSWGWALVSGGGHVVVPILARAWGCHLQMLRANFPLANEDGNAKDESVQWPAFGVHDEFDASAPVVALQWLSERALVYLTVTNEFNVVDTVMMTLLERLDFSSLRLVYAEFTLNRAAATKGSAPPPQPELPTAQLCTTFQNSFRSNDSRLIFLCQEELRSVSIIGTKDRIAALEDDGEWLEALALALDHYENTVKSQEDRRRDASGHKDLSKHPEFSHGRVSEDEEWIAELMMRYLSLAVENAPDPAVDQTIRSLTPNRSKGRGNPARIDLAHSHFQMLAGVCIEFCVVTRRLDLLFGPIFRRFQETRYTHVFIDVLEPYVLNDKLHYVAPEAMAEFVQQCKKTNDVATVERCLLHMDVTIMDFDSILTLLKKNGMFSALFHVYTHGLDDFLTPLEILMEATFSAADRADLGASRRWDGIPQSLFEEYGYKAILYMQHCLSGLSFPQGKKLEPEDRIQRVRAELLHFLLQEKHSPSVSVSRNNNAPSDGHRATAYPYMFLLLLVDAKALIDTISRAFDAPDAKFARLVSEVEPMGGWEVEVGADSEEEKPQRITVAPPKDDTVLCPEKQQIVRVLSSVVSTLETKGGGAQFGNSSQAVVAKDAFLDFMAKYLLKGEVQAPKSLSAAVISRMSDRVKTFDDPLERRASQGQISSLLEALPHNSYDRVEVLSILERNNLTRAALLLHKGGLTASIERGENDESAAHHFVRALDCYLEDDDDEFRKEIFEYSKKECMGGNRILVGDRISAGSIHDRLRSALCTKMSELINLDAVLSAQLVAEIFIENIDQVLSSFANAEDGRVQFKFLQAVISGELTQVDSIAGPVLLANLSMDHNQRYIALMARFQPDAVYQHLSTHDNYRAEECLQICQEYEIADASAYLLERMGNVSSALQLMLQTLEARMVNLKRFIRGSGQYSNKDKSRRMGSRSRMEEDSANAARKEKEIAGVKQILVVALDLCERNSGQSSGKSEQGSQLWFNVLDRLINAKGFLRLSKELPEHSALMSGVLSELLHVTMERMVSNVALPDLVRKITTDHAGNRLGEFREMLVTLLKTYSSELDVCASALDVMHHDVRQMSVNKKKLKLRALPVRSLMGKPLVEDEEASPSRKMDFSSIGPVVTVTSNGEAGAWTIGGMGLGAFHHPAAGDSAVATSVRVAQARLRQRRAKKGQEGGGGAVVNMMTESDRRFCQGESSESAFLGPRRVGGLSSAEHFGRLF